MKEKVEEWDKIKVGNEKDKCPKCKTGVLVYSHSNINRRTGSRIEYYYCTTCEMDTVIGRKE